MQLRTLGELASGVDALYLSGRSALPSELLERLEAAEDHERRVIIENMVESITVFPRPPGGQSRRESGPSRALLGGRAQGVGERASRWPDMNPHSESRD